MPGRCSSCNAELRKRETAILCWQKIRSLRLFVPPALSFARSMDAVVTSPRGTVSALVCTSRHRGCHAMELFGQKRYANGHVPLLRDRATLHGGCVRLRWRWEGDGVTGVVVSELFSVVFCALAGADCGRMLLRATVFGYYC
ncbi:hypothetical protein TcYC6_0024810 [Trypanosoma cruzi]|nr:hypothetical protein TcYC6_0024810 [Trypanosoma cruzi]